MVSVIDARHRFSTPARRQRERLACHQLAASIYGFLRQRLSAADEAIDWRTRRSLGFRTSRGLSGKIEVLAVDHYVVRYQIHGLGRWEEILTLCSYDDTLAFLRRILRAADCLAIDSGIEAREVQG